MHVIEHQPDFAAERRAWLVRFLWWPMVGAAGFAAFMTLLAAESSSLTRLAVAVLLWGYTLLLCWARGRAAQASPRVAGLAASLGILILAGASGLIEPHTLATVPVSATFAIVVGLRSLDTRALRLVIVAAWLVQLAALILAALLPLGAMTPTTRAIIMVGNAIGVSVTFLLLWQHHRHLTALLSRLQQANDELTAAHAALAERDARYELAIGAGNILVWDWCLRTDRLLIHGRIGRLLDASSRTTTGAVFWDEVIHPEDVARVRQAAGAYIEGRADRYEIAHRVVDRRRETRHIITRGELLRDAAGAPLRMVGTCTDVTERVRAEQALVASEARYRALTSLASDYTFALRADPDGSLHMEWARAQYEGLPDASRALLYDLDAQRRAIHPEDAEAYAAFISALAAGQPASAEVRMFDPQGECSTYAIRARPEHEPAPGEPTRIIGVARNITAEREATEAVRFLSEASAALAGSIDDGETLRRAARIAVPFLADHCTIRVVDGGSRVLAVAHPTPEGEMALGEMLRQYPLDLHGPHPGAEAIRSNRPILVERVDDAFFQRHQQDDRHRALSAIIGRPTSVMFVPLLARGRTLGVITLTRVQEGRHYTPADLSLAEHLAHRVALAVDNARLFADLRASERRYRALVEAAVSVIICVDSNARILEFNQEAERVTGYSRDEVIGRDYPAIFEPHVDRAQVVDVTRQVLMGRDFRDAEAELVTRTGELRRMNWHLTRVYDADDQVVAVLAIGQDVTDRRRAEAERQAIERSMQQAQRLESLGVMAGGIAHDFNNLLAVIVGNAGLARLELPDDHPACEPLGQIDLAAQRAAELIRQMLAYAGKGHVNAELLDPNQLIAEMTQLLSTSVPRTTRFDICLTPSLPAIQADAAQIRQVIMNLVINAAESIVAPDGMVTLRTGVRHLEAHAAISGFDLPPGDYVLIEVVDTGCGMDEATLARIFDPFFTTKFTGRGLGLAAVLGIVRGHRGALHVESAPGRGTHFTVMLPARPWPDHAPGAGDPARQAAATPRMATVLVVDDDAGVLRAASRLAERLGFQTLTAADGQAGIEAFHANRDHVACVLLDLTMPRLDGAQALAALRRAAPDLPIVLMSGYSAQEMSQRFADIPRTRFLQKPFTSESLHEALVVSLEQIPYGHT